MEIKDPLSPSVSLLCKLGSAVVHIEEATSAKGHTFDRVALNSLLADPELKEWLEAMRRQAFLPVKRQ